MRWQKTFKCPMAGTMRLSNKGVNLSGTIYTGANQGKALMLFKGATV